MRPFLIISFIFAAFWLPAQNPCHFDQVLDWQIRSGEHSLGSIEAMDLQLARAVQSPRRGSDTAHYVLPIIFNVVHQNGPERVPESEVRDAFDHLNLAFANAAPYDPSRGVPIDVSFCLATQNRFGQPSTGVEYIFSPNHTTSIDSPFEMMSLFHSPTDKVINVFLVSRLDNALAFGTFPTATEGRPVDGIVISADIFSNALETGAILAHEMGHFLGLYHTFQNGCRNFDCLMSGDRVCDTPPDDLNMSFEGCFYNNNCTTDADATNPENPFVTDGGDANKNFMDYNEFTCISEFTPGQRFRMRTAICQFRPKLLQSSWCNPPQDRDVAIFETRGLEEYHVLDALSPEVRIINNGTQALTSLTVEVELGATKTVTQWNGFVSGGGNLQWIELPPLPCPEPGLHTVRISLVEPNGTTDDWPADNEFTHAFAVPHAGNLPYRADFELGHPGDALHWNILGEEWRLQPISGCTTNGNQGISLVSDYYATPSASRWISPWFDFTDEVNPLFTLDLAIQAGVGFEYTLRIIPVDGGDTLTILRGTPGSPLVQEDDQEIWTPESCADWEQDSVDLPEWTGKRAFIELTTTTGYEEIIRGYIDNVYVTSQTAEVREAGPISDADFSLYPNPTNDRVTVDARFYRDTDLRYELFFADGRQVLEGEATDKIGDFSLELDLSGQARGVYLLRMQVEDGVFFRKILRQ